MVAYLFYNTGEMLLAKVVAHLIPGTQNVYEKYLISRRFRGPFVIFLAHMKAALHIFALPQDDIRKKKTRFRQNVKNIILPFIFSA